MVSFIQFIPGVAPRGWITKVWHVQTMSGAILGDIRWFGAWRKYCFYPVNGTIFDKGCLRDIANFCEGKTDTHGKS